MIVLTTIIPEVISRFAAQAEAFGLPAALSFICLMQYVLHIYNRYSSHARETRLISDLKNLEGEMSDIQRERYVTRIENMILREVFAGTASGKAVELLLKQFVPHSADGFVIFYCRQQGRLEVFQQRGLTEKTASQLQLEPEWIKRVVDKGVLRLTSSELANSRFVDVLDPRERKKIEQLHLITVADQDEIFGVIATTDLFPPCVDLATQQAVVGRILESVTGSLRQTMQLVDHQHLLRLTQEKLALRTIADRNHDDANKLLDEYLQRLTGLVDATRGTLLLTTQNRQSPFKVISRQGQMLQSGLEQTWSDYERLLADTVRNTSSVCSMSAVELSEMGIESLIGSALVVPLRNQGHTVGVVCLARPDAGIFTSMQINLADWAATFLGETLVRVLDRAETQRRASTDGLTNLANRRSFDKRIQKEVEQARHTGTECSLCLFDLDHFKSINDTYGHLAGDEVLKQFARILITQSQHVRGTDVPLVARYGGEEMAMLLPGVNQQGAMRISEAIRRSIERTSVLYQGRSIRVSVSVGIACFPRHAQTVESLIRAADKALYAAKRAGRNTVRHAIWQEELPSSSEMAVVR